MQWPCALLSSLACPSQQYFSTLSHERQHFSEKVIEHKMCGLIFSRSFVGNIFHSKKNWARYDRRGYLGLHVKYPLFLSDFNETWIFSTDFWNIKFHEYPFSESRVVACGRTDRLEEDNSRFSHFLRTHLKNEQDCQYIEGCFRKYRLSAKRSIRTHWPCAERLPHFPY
jgi:hypothetical protein